ncbi:MAG: YciI family protein [Gaiellaceae bacterium]
MTWAYFYLMKDDPARVRETAPQHAQYWKQTDVSERGGPFSDRSGGLIVFEAPSEGAAQATIGGDPFQRAALLEQWWLKAWEPDSQRV